MGHQTRTRTGKEVTSRKRQSFSNLDEKELADRLTYVVAIHDWLFVAVRLDSDGHAIQYFS